jgi:hypothetical protein
LYPAIELLLWKWGAFPQPLFNSTAGDETVLTNQISIAQLVGQSQFVCDFRILARMKAVSATMLSPNFFLECAVHNLIPTLSSVSCVTVARVVQERRKHSAISTQHSVMEVCGACDDEIENFERKVAIRNCSNKIHREGGSDRSSTIFVFIENQGRFTCRTCSSLRTARVFRLATTSCRELNAEC